MALELYQGAINNPANSPMASDAPQLRALIVKPELTLL
ncbi:hypothetical protein CEV33_4434 [Brucella grignonensis]|uniref:Uncharacterized protein n=1 Tax=Brucella grignonensis TaxID=94627 RepID=A0A256FNH7_9HYPH|nr:hypothetical protein CEV33_4434 [Brucella grignonensis]